MAHWTNEREKKKDKGSVISETVLIEIWTSHYDIIRVMPKTAVNTNSNIIREENSCLYTKPKWTDSIANLLSEATE